jgi:hypothetical protein
MLLFVVLNVGSEDRNILQGRITLGPQVSAHKHVLAQQNGAGTY